MLTRIRFITNRGAAADDSTFGVTASAQRLGASMSAIPPAGRVWLQTAVLAIVAGTIWLTLLKDLPEPTHPVISWPFLAVAFALAELKVVEVHFRRETHAFSLSEFPAVIGFFSVSPTAYLLALMLGTGVTLVLQPRQRLIKTVFNLANFLCVATISLAIVHAVGDMRSAPGPLEWVATFAATLAATAISAISIASVITLSGGAPQFEKLPEMLQFGSMVALANTSLALLAVVVMQNDPLLLALLALPLVIVFVAYRSYLSEREKHERLELLYQSSRILQHSPELDSSIVAILDHARAMFRAELAEVVLYPRVDGAEALRTSSYHDGEPEAMVPTESFASDRLRDMVQTASGPFYYEPPNDPRIRQGMVGPLRGESELIGSLLIANRLTEGTSFSDDDLRLLETLANQVGVALENGHLERSLAELSRLKEELRYQAYHDPLTGLANRSLFTERVDERARTAPPGRLPAVLFLDLDDFKIVNDTLGHAAGDHLLVEVAERLRATVRTNDVAARLGGDEFAVLIDDTPELVQSVTVAQRILDALATPFLLGTTEVVVGGSIGIAAARTGAERANELLRNADVAMYKAKQHGKNRVATFEPAMHTSLVERHELSAELVRSLGRGELVLLYQPILHLETRRTVGFEALVRWRHPTRGLLAPVEFIPLAEETGTIVNLGTWVLEEACRQGAEWSSNGPPLMISVNLAAQQLQQPDFVPLLVRILERTGLPAERLVLELTETAIFHDTTTTLSRLEEIRQRGVRVAIDDFGTGYSSLGYLRKFRADILKIAREFVGEGDRDDWPFAAAIVALGQALDMTIVAEGIEKPGQLAHLMELGCELGQGYLFALPLTADAAAEFLAAHDGAAVGPSVPALPGGLTPTVARATR